MSRRILIHGALLAMWGVGATVLPSTADAQSCSGGGCNVDHTVSVTVPEVLILTLDGTATALTPPNAMVYAAGVQADPGPSVTIQANRSWDVQVNAMTDEWMAAGGGREDKAADDLSWTIDGGTSYTPITTTPTSLFGGPQGASSGATPNAIIGWQTAWAAGNDTPGDYSLVVRFTLVAP